MRNRACPVVSVEPLENRTLFAVTVAPFTPSDGLVNAVATNGRRAVIGAEVEADADNAYLDLYDFFGRRTERLPLNNGAINGDAEVHDVAMAANGSFVAVWVQTYNDERGFLAKSEIHARRFAADGRPVTPRIEVFTARSRRGSIALHPSVAINDVREFVVAYDWRRDSEDSGSAEDLPKRDVAAKMYAADGELRHAVNVARSNRDEGDSEIAMRPQSRGFDIVYTLEDKSDDADGQGPVTVDTDIVLARFRSDGTLRDGGRRKVAATSFEEVSPSISISPDGSQGVVGWNRTIPGHAAGRRSGRQYTGQRLGERFNIGSFGRLQDLAIFNSGVSIASLEDVKGFVLEDPENLTGGEGTTIEVTPGIMSVQGASVAVGSNGRYVSVFIEELIDDEPIHVGYVMMGIVPEIQ